MRLDEFVLWRPRRRSAPGRLSRGSLGRAGWSTTPRTERTLLDALLPTPLWRTVRWRAVRWRTVR